jgi:ATP-dependent phosphofructokinase / diphosphate-dependent phosphofructokinase
MRIGVLTGGGDAPGLNAAIRGVTRRALEGGDLVVGIKNGWAGLLGSGDTVLLTPRAVDSILQLGGTILGTSRTNPLKSPIHLQEVLDNLAALELDALIPIGGDDTLSVAYELHRRGVKVVGVPKTVDNDLAETEYCIGFDTAIGIVAEALDRLHTTAMAHHRILVVEVMGREAGWVALKGGMAGGAELILIPEVQIDLDWVCQTLQRHRAQGKDASIIVVAEGVELPEAIVGPGAEEVDAFGHVRLDRRGVGDALARYLEKRTGHETRVTVLGHLQRGGTPSAYDRIMATRCGVAAVDLLRQGQVGYLAGVRGDSIYPVPLEQVVGHARTVDPELYEIARVFF